MVRTDHRNLVYLASSSVPKLVRWRQAIGALSWNFGNRGYRSFRHHQGQRSHYKQDLIGSYQSVANFQAPTEMTREEIEVLASNDRWMNITWIRLWNKKRRTRTPRIGSSSSRSDGLVSSQKRIHGSIGHLAALATGNIRSFKKVEVGEFVER